ncbi:MAG: S8 family serine peptidase [Synergistaceae bacterium]|nr:S8 family serine peptidase [Synergistaceae bacterium]
MKKIFLCMTMIFALAVPAYSAEYIPGDVLVVLKPSDTSGEVQASALRTQVFAANSGTQVKEVYSSLSDSGKGIYALLHSDSQSADVLAQQLLDNPEVLAASPNYIVRAAVTPNDSYMKDLWGMEYINAPSAWDITTGSSDVYVAVIDSGIDDTNPDLTDNVATEYGTNVIYTNSDSPKDDYGHGTHVSGIIGAAGNNGKGVAGVSWNVKLIPIKALDDKGTGSYSNVISGMNYAANLIKQGVNICAVNLSLETYIPTAPTHDNLVKMPLWRAFKELDELNKAVIVVAAGNYSAVIGEPTTTTQRSGGSVVYGPGEYVYPPSFTGLDNMISVSALGKDGVIASFSNTGATISAPGVDILSTWLQSSWIRTIFSDGISTSTMKGTSMAAPHVSGAIALVASMKPGLTAYQLKQAVINGSEISSAEVQASASGILDVRAVLDYVAANTAAPDNTNNSDETDTNNTPNTSDNTTNLPQKSTENNDYNDYTDYTPTNEAYGQRNADSGGGGCSGLMLNVYALALLIPLAKKFMG